MKEEEEKKRTRKGEIYIGDIVHYFLVYTTPRCKTRSQSMDFCN